MASDKYSEAKPILHSQCKRMLCRVLEVPPEVEILDVKVWKQESRIDLWVEVELKRNGNLEHHSVLIESKF